MSSKQSKQKPTKGKGKELVQAKVENTSASVEKKIDSNSSDEAAKGPAVDTDGSKVEDAASTETLTQETVDDAAVNEMPSKITDTPCTILRDDEDCFLADFTKSANQDKKNKFELWDPFRRGRISPQLVEMDPDVTLRIRSAPGLDASEVGLVHPGDTFDVAGRCGFWLRMCGDDERWVLEKTDELILVEILPSSSWGLSWGRSLLSTWGSQGSPASQVKKEQSEEKVEVETTNDKSSSGWGLGLLSRKVTEYVPTVSTISLSASAVASSAVSKILAAGANDREDAGDSIRSDEETVVVSKIDGSSEGASALADLKVDDEGVELEQGGLAPVRIVSQGITYIEGTLGWLGGVAGGVKAAALDSSTMLLSDEIVDKAWEGVKGTAKASKNVVCGSTEAICHVTELGRAALVNVAEAVLPVTSGSSRDLFPNRSLGGVLAIELCGGLVQRDPLADEDDDPFQSDDYVSTPAVPGAFAAVARLVQERFQQQAKLLRWMAAHDVYAHCGIPRENVHMCREPDEKEDLLRELQADHVVDSGPPAPAAPGSAVAVHLIDCADGAAGAEAWWARLVEELLPLLPPADEPAGDGPEPEPEPAGGDAPRTAEAETAGGA